ncbi:MAG: response regulator [Eubacteriales bacterium]|nr:response regulator [Eubacteriales bacterium]
MLKVMLADDNKFALNHFTHLVDWGALGFQMVYGAVDGIDALGAFHRFHPDIVITDVQMPGIDGRELARRIKGEAPETMVIFLSSYDEFDYARAAIDLSVQEYILKHELNKEFLENKLREINRIFQEKEEKRNRAARVHLAACFRTPIEDLDTEFFQEVSENKFNFFVLEQDHIPDTISRIADMRTIEIEHHIWIPELRDKFPELLNLVRIERYRFLGLTADSADCEELGTNMKSFLESETDSSFSLYLYKRSLSVLQCRQEYEKHRYLFEQRYFEGRSAVLQADLFEQPKAQPMPSLDDFEIVLNHSLQEVNLYIDRLFREFIYNYDFTGTMELLIRILEKLKYSAEKMGLPYILYDEEVYCLLSVRRIFRWLKSKVSDLAHFFSFRKSFQSDAAARTVAYIYKEYRNPFLSVEEIAEFSGLSVNRLNDLMKKEEGETIGRLLTRIRMEKAKELLEAGKECLPDIAQMTGYSSVSYFSRVFRKNYGLSPQDYRRGRRDE